MPNRQERLTGLFVVLGGAIVFGPIVLLLERWREVISRDPASAWGGQWLSERLSAQPYLTLGTLLLGMAVLSALVMVALVGVAKRLAARFTSRTPRP